MPRYFPSPEQFNDLAAGGFELIPVYRQLLADHLTPVTAFEVLGRDAHAFLLESVVGGERVARYSDLLATFFINIGTGEDREAKTSLDGGRQQHEQAEREEQWMIQ